MFYKCKVYADAPEAWQLGLQDPASPAVEGMIFFHDYLFFFFNRNWCLRFLDVIQNCC
jgi:hypothetical protein